MYNTNISLHDIWIYGWGAGPATARAPIHNEGLVLASIAWSF